jgi:tetratricopeptide (TPR) repeat protein
VLLALGAASAARQASAQEPPVQVEVVPSEVEWTQFPPYCKARYSITLYALGTVFEGRVPPSEIESWKHQMGQAWDALHHYCYGLVQMSRAPLIKDPNRREYLYDRASDEFGYAFRNTDHDNPFNAKVAVQLSMAFRAKNKTDQALRYANEAQKIDPKLDTGYSATALILRQGGKLAEAAEVLKKGLAAVDGESAELNYFLGLTYFDLKNIDLARQYADKAYALGYPLPGLRNRLARVR